MRVIRDSVRKCEFDVQRRGWLGMKANVGHTAVWGLTVAAGLLASGTAMAADAATQPAGLLETIHRHTVVTSTIAPNGDQNPYAVIVAPVSAGNVQKNDVLITNFNNAANLQGLGTTIVDFNPATRKLTTLATIPRHLASCPGGIGLSTALTMLKTGWIIVGSTPSQDGTTGTKGPGCLLVLDPKGNVVSTFAGANINDPWGNMAVVDNGSTATLFVSMTGFGVESPGQPTVNQGHGAAHRPRGAGLGPADDDEADRRGQRIWRAGGQGRFRDRGQPVSPSARTARCTCRTRSRTAWLRSPTR